MTSGHGNNAPLGNGTPDHDGSPHDDGTREGGTPQDRGAGIWAVGGYVALVFAVAAAFYVAGPMIGTLSRITRADVPGSALMFVCPGLATSMLVHRAVRGPVSVAGCRSSFAGPSATACGLRRRCC